MGVNKFEYFGETKLNLSADTVTPSTLVTGITAHDASGEPIVGENPYELEATNAEVGEQAELIAQIRAALVGKAAGSGGGVVIGDENIADPDGIIPDKYINANGAEQAYNGWSISDYIPVDPAKRYSVVPFGVLANLQYSGFYDAGKVYLRQVSKNDFASQKINILAPPADARYMRFSDTDANIEALGIYEVTGG